MATISGDWAPRICLSLWRVRHSVVTKIVATCATLIVAVLLPFGVPCRADNFVITGPASGPNSSLMLSANIVAGVQEAGAVGNLYVGAYVPGSGYFFLSHNAWVAYDGSTIPAYETTTLGTNKIAILTGNLNVTSLVGTTVYAGYGTSQSDLIGKQQYNAIYQIASANTGVANTSASLLIKGSVAGHTFNIPCDQLTYDFSGDYSNGLTYSAPTFTSASSGISFVVVLPTKSSLYPSPAVIGSYASYDLTNEFSPPPSASNAFQLGMRLPFGSDTYTSLQAGPDVKSFTHLLDINQVSRGGGKVVYVLHFQFQMPMIDTNGSTLTNATLSGGELWLKVTVADA